MYKVLITKSVQKEIDVLPNLYYVKILQCIYGLQHNPRPSGCKKLSSLKKIYRVRVGSYRIIYRIEDDILFIEIITVGHRKDIYKG